VNLVGLFSTMQEMILPLLFALLALSVAELLMRRWIRGPNNDMRTTGQRRAMHTHLSRGTPVNRISREARMPHDVVGLALYVERNREKARRAAPSASSAARGN
jgi:hypothetical protein